MYNDLRGNCTTKEKRFLFMNFVLFNSREINLFNGVSTDNDYRRMIYNLYCFVFWGRNFRNAKVVSHRVLVVKIIRDKNEYENYKW